MDIDHYKPETLRRRLPACLRAARAASIGEARDVLEHAPRRRQAAVSALVIGTTQFFRDGVFFSSLVGRVLPELVAKVGGGGAGGAALPSPSAPPPRTLRVWSVGCSNGAELYSVAMLLAEHGVLDRCQLLGTDCRPEAIEQARAGVYEPASLAQVPQDLLARYFRPADPADPAGAAGSRLRVVPALRDAIHWRTGNALAVSEPGAWDLILCRNVAIYLRPGAAAELWRRLRAALHPGGVLALGKAERPTATAHLSPAGPCLYRLTGATGCDGGRP